MTEHLALQIFAWLAFGLACYGWLVYVLDFIHNKDWKGN